jgi:hypothetical protein
MVAALELALPSAALVTLVLFSYSGVGRLIFGAVCTGSAVRTVAADYVAGFLAFSALFGLAAQLAVPFVPFVTVFGVLGLLGLYTCIRSGQHDLRGLGTRVVLGLVVALSVLLSLSTPSTHGVGDVVNYVAGAAKMFHNPWFTAEGVARLIGLVRGPALALVWTPAAFGRGVGLEHVYGLGIWQMLLSMALLIDLFVGAGPLLLRLGLAIGSVGMFNVTALLVSGQINQPYAPLVMICMVWLYRYVVDRRARIIVLALSGYVIMGAYPEFLVASPLYFACIALLHRGPFLVLVGEGVAFASGVLLVQVTTRFASARFLMSQASGENRPGWMPLPAAPQNPLEVWSLILIQNGSWWLVAAVLIPVGIYLWESVGTRADVPGPPRRMAALAVGVVGLMGVVWTWAVLTAANVNYSAFKLAGWLGPGLFVLTWLAAQTVPPVARRALTTAVLAIVVARVVGMHDGISHLFAERSALGYWQPRHVYSEQSGSNDNPCMVNAASAHIFVMARAEAESAAPTRGCGMATSELAEVATVYKTNAPSNWATGETRSYVVDVVNLSTERWERDGPTPIRLSVRFIPADGVPIEVGPVGLPHPVGSYGGASLPINATAPTDAGDYVIEHRIVREPGIRSEQALQVPIRVQ